MGLHFMRHKSVIIDTTHGLVHFPDLTKEVQSAASKTSAKHQSVHTDDTITIPASTTRTNKAFGNHPLE